MPVYHIERGGHADMKRIYPMMTFDFHDWERPSHLECQRAMLRGAELLLLKDAQNAECGYAFMLKSASQDMCCSAGWPYIRTYAAAA